MAKTVIEELVTIFGFEVDKSGAASAIKTYTDLRNLASDLVRVARAASRAVLEPIKHVVQLGEHAVNTGRRIGATAEQVQQLGIMARATGVSSSVLEKAIEKLGSSSYASVTRHKEHVLALARVGVVATDATGKLKPPTQLFFEMAEGLSKIDEPGKRTRLAFQLMGEQAGQLMPLLAMGPGYLGAIAKVAAESGAVLSNETAQAAKDVAFWWQILTIRSEGLENRLGGGLLPIASKIIGSLGKWWAANKKVVDQGIDVIVQHITTALTTFVQVLSGVASTVSEVVNYFGGFNTVLTTLEILLGAGFVALVGAATAALISLGFALLFVNIWPFLIAVGLGLMVGALALVLHDLSRADSLIKEIFGEKINADDAPIIKALKTMAEYATEIKDGLVYAKDFWTGQNGAVGKTIDSLADKKGLEHPLNPFANLLSMMHGDLEGVRDEGLAKNSKAAPSRVALNAISARGRLEQVGDPENALASLDFNTPAYDPLSQKGLYDNVKHMKRHTSPEDEQMYLQLANMVGDTFGAVRGNLTGRAFEAEGSSISHSWSGRSDSSNGSIGGITVEQHFHGDTNAQDVKDVMETSATYDRLTALLNSVMTGHL